MKLKKLLAVLLSVMLVVTSLSMGVLPVQAAETTIPTLTIGCYGGIGQYYVLPITSLVKGESYTLSLLWRGEGSTYSLSAYGSALGNTQSDATLLVNGSSAADQYGLTYDPDTSELSFMFVAKGSSLTVMASLATGTGGNAQAHLADVRIRRADGSTAYIARAHYEDGVPTGFVNGGTAWGTMQYCKMSEQTYKFFWTTEQSATAYPCKHTFTNVCDTDCNSCGAERVPADHSYNGDTDNSCNSCGHIRSLPSKLPTVYMYFYAGASQQAYTTTLTGLSVGASYQLSLLYKHASGTPAVLLDGKALIVGATAQNGASYNADSGLLLHTFTATAKTATLRFELQGSDYAGAYLSHLTVADSTGNTLRITTGVYSNNKLVDLSGWNDVLGSNSSLTFTEEDYSFFGLTDPAFCNHAYANVCDIFCDICGQYRTVAGHRFENVCDADCDLCGYERNVVGHRYDNDCDAACNVCLSIRTTAPHVYSSGCDATCDSCGATRTAVHNYDGACDPTCNTCGSSRVADDHVYTDDLDGICNRCGYSRASYDFSITNVPALRMYAWGGVTQGYGVSIKDLVPGREYTLSFLWRSNKGNYSAVAYGSALGSDWNTRTILAVGNTIGKDVTFSEEHDRYTYTFTAVGTELLVYGSLETDTGSAYSEAYLADICVTSTRGTIVYRTQGMFEDGSLVGWVGASARWGKNNYCFFETKGYSYFDPTAETPTTESLSSLVVDGAPFHFDPYIYTYNITVPNATSKLNVTFALGADAKPGSVPGLSGNNLTAGATTAVTVSVTNRDGSTTKYVINAYRRTSSEETYLAKSVKVMGGATSFNADHKITLVPGKTYVVEALYKDVSGNKVNVTVFGEATLGMTLSLVENGKGGKGAVVDPATGRYSYTFTAMHSNATIRIAASNYAENQTVSSFEGWVGDIKVYQIDPESGKRISGTDIPVDNTFTLTTDGGSWTRSSYGGNFWRVQSNKARSFFKLDGNSLLSNLKLNGSTVPGFHSAVFHYASSVPYTKTITLAATKGSGATSAVIYNEDGDVVSGSVNVRIGKNPFTVVTANADGTETTYTLTVTVQPAPAPQLNELGVVGYAISPAFDPSVKNYSLVIPYRQTSLPLYYNGINYTKATVLNGTAIPDGVTTPVTVSLTGIDGSVVNYVINVYREAYADRTVESLFAQLSGGAMLTVDPSGHTINVLYGTTLADVIGSLPVVDGITYRCYDEDLTYIDETYFGQAVIRDNFGFDVYKDGALVSEWRLNATDTLSFGMDSLVQITDPTVLRADEALSTVTVSKNTTAAALVAALDIMADDVALALYDASGALIPSKNYASTALTDGCVLQILRDGKAIGEWAVTTVSTTDMSNVGILDLDADNRTAVVRSGTTIHAVAELLPSLPGTSIAFYDNNGNLIEADRYTSTAIRKDYTAKILKGDVALTEWSFTVVASTACRQHTYESPCDDTCFVCGATRKVTHSCTDGACSKCCQRVKTYSFTVGTDHGSALSQAYVITLTVADDDPALHKYDNGCDTTCNNCGKIREGVGHVYDNVNDTTCNNCGEVRDINTPHIVIDQQAARPGDTIEVPIRLVNNPGIVSMVIDVAYDTVALELINAKNGNYDGNYSYSQYFTKNPYRINWYNALITEDVTGDDVFATLVFKVKEDAPIGDYHFAITYKQENVYNFDYEDVVFATDCGVLKVVEKDPATIVIDEQEAAAGDTIRVPIRLVNNPGIASMVIDVAYDSAALELIGNENGNYDGNYSYSQYFTKNPYRINWYNALTEVNIVGDDIFATLIFKVKDDAPAGEYGFAITYDQANVCDIDYNDVYFATECGTVTVMGDPATIVIDDQEAVAGDTIEVPIRLVNNPGIASMVIDVAYDTTALELIGNKNGNYDGNYSYSQYFTKNPYRINWYNALTEVNIGGDDIFVTLIFKVKDAAPEGSYTFTITYDQANVCDVNYNDVYFDTQCGSIAVTAPEATHTPGDINGDGAVNNRDYMFLTRYLNEWGVEVVEAALDITNDGVINNRDAMTLNRYLNEWDVTIY